MNREKIHLFPVAANPPKKSYSYRKSLLVRPCGCFFPVPVGCSLYFNWLLRRIKNMMKIDMWYNDKKGAGDRA